MANGSRLLLAEYKRKLDCGETIPQIVTNAVMLEALIEIYGVLDGVREFMADSKAEKLIDEERDKDKLSGRRLWENYGRDIVKLVIAVLIGYFLSQIGLK